MISHVSAAAMLHFTALTTAADSQPGSSSRNVILNVQIPERPGSGSGDPSAPIMICFRFFH